MSEESLLQQMNQIYQNLQDQQNQKKAELDEREKVVTKREQILQQTLKEQQNESKIVKIKVGDTLFTTTVQVLNSVKDTPLAYLVAEGVGKFKEDDAYFFARDPKSFEVVLEYLTYGEVLSTKVSKNLWKRVAVDADFYGLKELETLAKAESEKAENEADINSRIQTVVVPGTTVIASDPSQNGSHTVKLVSNFTGKCIISLDCGVKHSSNWIYTALKTPSNSTSQGFYTAQGNITYFSPLRMVLCSNVKKSDTIEWTVTSHANSHHVHSVNDIVLRMEMIE